MTIARGGRRYGAFISYSRAADGRLAPQLQRGLHRLATPWYRTAPIRTFRDKESLSASPGLWSSIEESLAESAYFVLLASEEAAKSHWVQKEVEWWLEHRSSRHLLIVLTDGELLWDDADAAFDPRGTTALPPALHHAFTEEPLWVDLRWARDADQVSLRHPGFREAVAQITAPIRGVPKEQLVGDDVRQQRRTLQQAWSAAALLVVLAITAAVAAVVAVDQRNDAVLQARLATSRQLASAARDTMTTSPRRSLLLAAEAFGAFDTAEARGALLASLQRDGVATRYLGDAGPGQGGFGFSPDGSAFAAVTTSGVALWSVPDWQRLGRLGDSGPAAVLAFSPDGAQLAATTADSPPHVQIWDVPGRRLLRSFPTSHTDRVDGIAFVSPDLVVTGGVDATARSWDPVSGRLVAEVVDLFSTVDSLAVSPDRQVVALGVQGHRITLWNPRGTGAPRTIEGPVEGPAESVNGLAFAPDGHSLYSGTIESSAVTRWDLTTLKPAGKLYADGTGSTVSGLAISTDGRLAVVAVNGGALLWDLTSTQIIGRLSGEGGAYGVAISRDGRHIGFGGSGGITVADLQSHANRSVSRDGHAETVVGATILDVAISPDGTTIASGATDNEIVLWSAADHAVRSRIAGHRDFVYILAFDSTGRRLLSGSGDGDVATWDVDTGQELQRVSLGAPVSALAVSPAGLFAVATGELGQNPDPSISIRRLDSGQVVTTLQGHTATARSLTFDPTGRILASAAQDGTVRLWDVHRGSELATLGGHDTFLSDVSFSPDGELLASADSTGTVIIWRVSDHSRVRQSKGTSAWSVAFAPDGRTLYTTGSDGVTLWQVPDLRMVSEPLRGTEASAGDLVVSPDGRSVIAADGVRLRFWDVSPDSWVRWACEYAGRNLTQEEWADYMTPTQPVRRTCPQYP